MDRSHPDSGDYSPEEPDDMNGHEEGEDCWCSPRVERYEQGNLIIHNEEN